jgi:hypothetical protein
MSIPGVAVEVAGLSPIPGIAGMEVPDSGFAGGIAIPGIGSAAGATADAGARRGAARRAGFLEAGGFAAGSRAAGLAGAGFAAGLGIFMPGIPGMSCEDAGIAKASALVAASTASTRFMPPLPVDER